MRAESITAACDRAAISSLMSLLMAAPHGQTTPSCYETARLVRLAPWLDGHEQRLSFLTGTQNPDGTWGAPDGYGLVPTLSATEALLSQATDAPNAGTGAPARQQLAASVHNGLRALVHLLGNGNPAVPDTIAVEYVVPQLVSAINARLDAMALDPATRSGGLAGSVSRLRLPDTMDHGPIDRLRDAARRGKPIPQKIWHSLEVLGPAAVRRTEVVPTSGVVAGSAAATAAWLGDGGRGGDRRCVRHLESLQAWHGGPVPGISPISVFEDAWVLTTLLDAGIRPAISGQVLERLHEACAERGAPAGPGLPPDADDTAAVLHALALAGSPRSTDCLWHYESESYFHCFTGERTPSTTTNAHVLDALGDDRTTDPARRSRLDSALEKVTRWLCEQQTADGAWWDKWHASPYYATACCALALARSASPRAHEAVRRAVGWVLATQRADGSWGRWSGTDEETAYAVLLLLNTGTSPGEAVHRAAARGCVHLLTPERTGQFAPLWHDKDLYAPVNVIRATRIAALRLASTRTEVAALTAKLGSDREPEQAVRV